MEPIGIAIVTRTQAKVLDLFGFFWSSLGFRSVCFRVCVSEGCSLTFPYLGRSPGSGRSVSKNKNVGTHAHIYTSQVTFWLTAPLATFRLLTGASKEAASTE
jgi:hypothetical protein